MLPLGLCRCNVPDMVSSYHKVLLKADEILSFLKIFVCFLKCRTYEDERGVYDVSNSKNIEVMLVWPEII